MASNVCIDVVSLSNILMVLDLAGHEMIAWCVVNVGLDGELAVFRNFVFVWVEGS